MNLADMLALLPDNTTGQISAADLRAVVTGLWDQGVGVDARVAALEEAGDGAPSVTGFWQVNPQAGAVPGGQQLTFSSAAIADATWIRFSRTDQNGIDFTAAIGAAAAVFLQQQNDAGNWARFEVTAAAVDAGTYLQLPVAYVDGAGSPASAGWQAAAVVLRGTP